jgi:hypothetical protein
VPVPTRQNYSLNIFVAAAIQRRIVPLMDWQEVIALGIVTATALVFAGRRLRRRKFSLQRDTHCGCSANAVTSPPPSIIFRARKGERPQVVVKMK